MNTEQRVLDAINGLEQDEIGELVRWQIEEGRKRGDHLPELGVLDAAALTESLAQFRAAVPALAEQIGRSFEQMRQAFVAFGEGVRTEIERQEAVRGGPSSSV